LKPKAMPKGGEILDVGISIGKTLKGPEMALLRTVNTMGPASLALKPTVWWLSVASKSVRSPQKNCALKNIHFAGSDHGSGKWPIYGGHADTKP
jgi:hypothetical protein